MVRTIPNGLGTLLARLVQRATRDAEDLPASGEPSQTVSSDQATRQALAIMLDEAVSVLKERGLPDRPGFYRRPHQQMEWTFLSSTMTPAERWAMVLEAPPGEGWRYATLPQVVRAQMSDDQAVQQAANVIEHGTACSNADQGGINVFDAAIKLAVAWAEFQIARAPTVNGRERLKLYFPPDDTEISMPTMTAPGVAKRERSRRGKPTGGAW